MAGKQAETNKQQQTQTASPQTHGPTGQGVSHWVSTARQPAHDSGGACAKRGGRHARTEAQQGVLGPQLVRGRGPCDSWNRSHDSNQSTDTGARAATQLPRDGPKWQTEDSHITRLKLAGPALPLLVPTLSARQATPDDRQLHRTTGSRSDKDGLRTKTLGAGDRTSWADSLPGRGEVG